METKNGVSAYRCSPYNRESECESIPCTDYYDGEKNKTVIIDDDCMTSLQVMICEATGLDYPVCHPFVSNHYYNVVYWVEPGAERRTWMARGLTPQWNHKDIFFFESPDDIAYLHVEVQRLNSRADPGTSHGRIVVGRSRIPLPKEFNCVKEGYFPLVRAEGECAKLEGDILVAMRLDMILI